MPKKKGSVSAKRATKLVKKGKAFESRQIGGTGKGKTITKIKPRARKGKSKSEWGISSEDMGKTKTVRAAKKKTKVGKPAHVDTKKIAKKLTKAASKTKVKQWKKETAPKNPKRAIKKRGTSGKSKWGRK